MNGIQIITITLGFYLICIGLGLVFPRMTPLNKYVYCDTNYKLLTGCFLLGFNTLIILSLLFINIIFILVLLYAVVLFKCTFY